jgi:hypothetical protein
MSLCFRRKYTATTTDDDDDNNNNNNNEQDHYYSMVLPAPRATLNMFNQSLTTLNLPSSLPPQIQTVVVLNTCSIVRKLNDKVTSSDEEADNPKSCHFTGTRLNTLISLLPNATSQQSFITPGIAQNKIIIIIY